MIGAEAVRVTDIFSSDSRGTTVRGGASSVISSNTLYLRPFVRRRKDLLANISKGFYWSQINTEFSSFFNVNFSRIESKR